MAAIDPSEIAAPEAAPGIWSALRAFIAFHVLQLVVGASIGLVAGLSFGLQGGGSVDLLHASMTPLAGLVGATVAGLWVMHTYQRQLRQACTGLRSIREVLAADPAERLLAGLAFGAGIAVVYLTSAGLLLPVDPEITGGPVTRMVLESGLGQLCWVVLALTIAPLFEELLFRGLIFEGFLQRAGFVVAAIASTLLFVLAHVSELVHYWPAALAIAALAFALAWTKLRSRGLGPCVAMHFGYNLVIVMAVVTGT